MLTDDGGDDDGHEGGDGRRRAGGEEPADRRHEVDGGGGGDGAHQLHRHERVHLADEGPPQLRALDHVRARRREGGRGGLQIAVIALAHRCRAHRRLIGGGGDVPGFCGVWTAERGREAARWREGEGGAGFSILSQFLRFSSGCSQLFSWHTRGYFKLPTVCVPPDSTNVVNTF